MNRNLFFVKEHIEGIDELDFMNESLVGFNIKLTRPVRYYRVASVDLLRPDMISSQFYGNERFWWIICYVNKINSVKDELVSSMVLKIPDLLDIYDFYKSKRKR